jgi:uncharacterized membrane protein
MDALLHGLRARLRGLRYGLLLVPGGITLALLGLGIVLSTVERQSGFRGFDVLFEGDPSTARTTLTTIAGAVATVAGVSFSITIVTLQLVSQQFSPRALRTFLADRITQVMVGTFVGTFAYVLAVLRVVRDRGSGHESFVPAVSVSVGMLLAVASLAVLLVFLHHMARVIQVSEMSAEITRATLSSLDTIFPETFGEAEDEDPEPLLDRWRAEREPRRVMPSRPGYIQSVMLDDLPRHFGGPGARLHVTAPPGAFVGLQDPLAEIWPAGEDSGLERAVRAAVVVHSSRDVFQDPLYGIRQLADIAVKAISPAVNDPSTAWTNIRYIGSIVERLAGRAFPSRVRRYEVDGGEVVVVVDRAEFEDYIDIGFVQIGRYSSGDARVVGVLLEMLWDVAAAAVAAGAHERLEPVLAAAEAIAGPALEDVRTEHDREEIRRRLDAVREAAAPALSV